MLSLLDPKEETRDKRSRLMWFVLIFASAAILLYLGFYKANRPAEIIEPPHYYTDHGPFINEVISIEPGKYRAFKLDLNRTGRLQGAFLVPDRETNVGCFVFTAENYEKWKKEDGSVETVIFTGFVWAGSVDRKLDPGVYYFILNNRENPVERVDVSVDLYLN